VISKSRVKFPKSRSLLSVTVTRLPIKQQPHHSSSSIGGGLIFESDNNNNNGTGVVMSRTGRSVPGTFGACYLTATAGAPSSSATTQTGTTERSSTTTVKKKYQCENFSVEDNDEEDAKSGSTASKNLFTKIDEFQNETDLGGDLLSKEEFENNIAADRGPLWEEENEQKKETDEAPTAVRKQEL